MKTTTNKLTFAIAALFFLGAHFSHAQTRLTGTVRDHQGKALPAASVLLLNSADSILVKGQLSSAEGTYSFSDIADGTYRLGVTMLGFEYQLSPVFTVDHNNPVQDLGATVLQESSAVLGEVSVVAKKPLYEQKIDRMVINVANSATNAGSTALEVLQRSPGVLVNRQSNSLSLAGKNGVVIMINGKINRMPVDALLQMLGGMNSDNIERIELIYTPPSSFDAEGNAGIINIILKKTADEGLNGGYSLNAGYGKREKYGAGLNFNYRKKKGNLFGNYDYRYNKNPQIFTNYRGIQENAGFLETESASVRDPNLHTQNAQLGVDFQLSPKTVVGVLGTFFDRYWDMYAVNDVKYSTNGEVNSNLEMITTEINHWNSWTGNVNFSHQFAPEKTLTVDADYVYYHIDNPSTYDAQYTGPEPDRKIRLFKDTPIRIGVVKADYTQHFGPKVQFETGVKGASSHFDNDVRVEELNLENWVVNPDFTSRFKLMEDIAAAYSSFSIKLNAKTDVKFGLRYEYTRTNLGSVEQPDVVDRRYGSWFPSAYINRSISEHQSVNLSYSRRIMRPGFTQLAPYLIFYDPTTLEGGNPALQPAFTNSVKLDYRIKSWQFSVEYNRENESIRDIPVIDHVKNTQFNRPVNAGTVEGVFSSIFFQLHPAKWWDMQNNVMGVLNKTRLKYEGSDVLINGGFVGFNTTQSITLPKLFLLEVSAYFYSPGYWGLYRWNSNGSLNAGIQKSLGEKWGTLNFNVSDIFLSANWYSRVDQPDLNLRVRTSYQQTERTFMLTWSNKFGNKKLRDQRRRATGAADEMRRL